MVLPSSDDGDMVLAIFVKSETVFNFYCAGFFLFFLSRRFQKFSPIVMFLALVPHPLQGQQTDSQIRCSVTMGEDTVRGCE